MPLDTTNRQRCAAAFMREALTESTVWTKPDLSAAVAAADTWVDDNSTSYNQALPLEFRTNATAAQKAALLAFVLWRRIGKLRVTEDI